MRSMSTARLRPAGETTAMESGRWCPATVVALDDGLRVQVAGESVHRVAQMAAGALLQPQVGDTVLLAMHDADCWAVLVLARHAASQTAQLTVPGAATVLLTAPALSLQVDELNVSAARTAARLGAVRLSARVLHVVAQRLALWADVIHTQAQSLVLRAEQRVTRIDRVDLLQAGQVLMQGEQLIQLEGRQIQAQAKENVLIDGKRILMG